MNVWFVVIGFVLIHYVAYGVIYMDVCMYFFSIIVVRMRYFATENRPL